LLLLLSACATNPEPLGGSPSVSVVNATELPAPVQASGDYLIGPYDQLDIDVFGIEDLSGREIQVDASGNASFPLVGVFKAGGKSLAEVRQLLTDRLRAAHVRNPAVSVNLKDMVSQQFAIDGQVVEPGVYPITGAMSLMRAVARAKGVSKYAKLDDVVVFRTVQGQRYAALYNLRAIRRGAYPDPSIYASDIVMVGDSKARHLFDDAAQFLPIITTPLILALQY
jgi:polysaccharide export outer membrane protein